mgnify:CR=1 FL=1
MGFGLIKVVGKNMEFLQLNELQLSKYDNHYQRLKIIFERTIELIETHHPDEIAIEAPFFGKNVQSMDCTFFPKNGASIAISSGWWVSINSIVRSKMNFNRW